ncbi:histone deacetylase family protein [Sulfurisphaera ohwakuensis]|uniref:Acetoin utilization deacetylase AcuC-like enzyme n=1 Tax=Sulfurisphaera ohwakuensis TaxID=69656 RepID=A0A650CJU6_SULOH|nr:histone deacetylase family protein [Sulfurisphaera ohwakuensis]MBB5253889.1 acetoin utilization deacetylase AcuC-like enzyme [Sulfurisphaera ohwakuensis]QGR17955.1 histone deacetylase family protein [Sulfurisphaera ohwakuensis]
MSLIPLIYSDVYLLHRPKYTHSENPDRIKRALEELKDYPKISPQKVSEEEVKLIHDEDYINLVKSSSKKESMIDADTYTSKETFDVALYALGGALKAFETNGFALLRPPGHHAGRFGKAFGAPTLGFCIFNNIAFPIRKYALTKVLIIDFDVHYGNGTQDIFWNDPEVVHIDIHQDPRTIYPGTGFPDMIGGKDAEGTKINLLIPPLGGDDLYEELIPIIQSVIDDFKPKIIAYSAGFDAFEGDGLASVRATEWTYYNMGLLSNRFERKYAVLEGGYGVGLIRGLKAFIYGLQGEKKVYPKNTSSDAVKSRFRNYLSEEKRILREFWKI